MASTTYLVVGLGNPGPSYRGTPHNAGFEVLDRLAAALGCALRRSLRFPARMGRGTFERLDVRLMQPRTFMNRSGEAVASWMRYHRLAPERLLVVVDDIDLPLGALRIRGGGGSGGHKGLLSIMENLGSKDFPRLRVGVGRGGGGGDVVRHVLTPFSPDENARFQEALDLAAAAVRDILREGLAAAMNRYNVRPGSAGAAPA